MKTYAAITIFLVQFLIAAASENILSTSLKNVTKSSNDGKDAKKMKCLKIPSCSKKEGKWKCVKKEKCFKIPPKWTYPRKGKGTNKMKCLKVPSCSKKEGKWKCVKKEKCFKIPSGRKRPVCKKSCSKRCTNKNPPRCLCKVRCTTTFTKWLTPNSKPKRKSYKEWKEAAKKRGKAFKKKYGKKFSFKKKKDSEEGFDEAAMDLDDAINIIDTIPDEVVNKQVHSKIEKGDVAAAEKIVHDYFDTYVSKLDDEDEKDEMLANKSKILAALDVAVEHYNDE